jgi:hypothetical protein
MKRDNNLKTLSILESYINKDIKDIYVTGYSEIKTNFNFFSAMLWWHYIEFEDDFLCLDSSNEVEQLQIYSCENFKCNFEIEEGDVFTVASIKKDISSKIISFEVFCNKESSKITALTILLKNSNYIFFDSLTWNGIDVGNKTNKNSYLQDNRFHAIKIPQ